MQSVLTQYVTAALGYLKEKQAAGIIRSMNPIHYASTYTIHLRVDGRDLFQILLPGLRQLPGGDRWITKRDSEIGVDRYRLDLLLGDLDDY